MSGFSQAMAVVFEAEGGLADSPWDRGGRTNYGISTPVWEDWRDRLGKIREPVDACTRDDARQIYHVDYWLRGKCDALPWPLSLVHFDSMVQHGRAPWLLQRALGVREDGAIGPVTLRAAAMKNPVRLGEDLLWIRLRYYRDLLDPDDLGRGGGQYRNIRGWIARMADLREYVVGAAPLPALT